MYTISFDWWDLIFTTETTLKDLLIQLNSSNFVCGYFYHLDLWMNTPKYRVYQFWAVSTSRIGYIKPFDDEEEFIKCVPDKRKDKNWNLIPSYTC